MRVLVVDDDFMVAKVHAGFVARTPGFEVVGTAHTGASALEAVAALEPDIVLLDVYLPDVNGLALLQQLRASAGPGAQAEVIVVTAANDAASVSSALRAGAARYLIKPFKQEELQARLEQVAARLRRLEELGGSGEARQDDVDRVFGGDHPPGAAAAGLPKGVAAETLRLVEQLVRDAGGLGLSASECAERSGMSRVSARRYLEFLAQQGAAHVSATYGGPGRPERRFRSKPARGA